MEQDTAAPAESKKNSMPEQTIARIREIEERSRDILEKAEAYKQRKIESARQEALESVQKFDNERNFWAKETMEKEKQKQEKEGRMLIEKAEKNAEVMKKRALKNVKGVSSYLFEEFKKSIKKW